MTEFRDTRAGGRFAWCPCVTILTNILWLTGNKHTDTHHVAIYINTYVHTVQHDPTHEVENIDDRSLT